MTNHCNRASLQPALFNARAREHTLAWTKKKVQSPTINGGKWSVLDSTTTSHKRNEIEPNICFSAVCCLWRRRGSLIGENILKGWIIAQLITVFTSLNASGSWLFKLAPQRMASQMPPSPSQGYSFETSLSFCFVMLCSGRGGGGGEHRGQANNQSEPSPEQLPRWGSYLTLAWGSPWEQHWTSRYEFVPLPQKSVPPRRPACLRRLI